MDMKECYVDVLDWLSQHPQNGITVRVKTEKELKSYQKYFQVQIDSDLFAQDGIYERIEWRIDPTIDK
jgi:hypothetical protein